MYLSLGISCSLFKKKIIFYLCGRICTCACTCPWRPEVDCGSLKLEVRHLMSVLGSKLRSSVRGVHTLNCHAVSLQPLLFSFCVWELAGDLAQTFSSRLILYALHIIIARQRSQRNFMVQMHPKPPLPLFLTLTVLHFALGKCESSFL